MTEKSGAETAVWILTNPDQPDVKIWGLPGPERLRRVLVAAGVTAEKIVIGSLAEIQAGSGSLLLFRSDYVFDERLVRGLVEAPADDNIILFPSTRSQEIVAAHVQEERCEDMGQLLSVEKTLETLSSQDCFHSMLPTDLVPAYNATLRKSDPPYLLSIQPDRIEEIENRLFNASYKGITDFVTKWVWPRPAQAVVRVLANAGVRPNTVTALSWLLVILATWLFAYGYFAFGLMAAWLMTFLDTVDGKLARVTLTSSKIGHVLDHGLDLVHPPFWYLAWAVGLPAGVVWLGPAIMITLVGYIVGRLLEGVFMLAFKMEIHSWRPIDSFFRLITARRNPNLILLSLGTLIGRPDWGLVFVAVWTLSSIAFHTVRLLQACGQRWRGQPLQMWQESETTA
jgi:phosphatidylglycerophosphate synthase